MSESRGMLPEGWNESDLLGLVAHVMDYRGRTPKKLGMKWGGGEIPALSAKNVTAGAIDLSRETNHGSDALYRRWMTNGDTAKDDVLITLEAPLGNIASIPDDRKYILSQRVVLLRAAEHVRGRFLFHQLSGTAFQSELIRGSTGTTATGIQRAKLEKLVVRFPITTSEQSRIAKILDALDEAIREAEAVIAKLRQVKAGLLHDLLTRGLDRHGHLRDPIRNPDQFQNSPLGLIPKAWAFTTLGNVLRERGGTMQTGPFGSQLHSSDYATEGIPVIMPQDIGDDGEMDTVAAAKITPERAQPLSRHRIRQGDIIFARRGDLSRCGVARSTEVGLCGTGCLLYRPGPKGLHPEWFATVYRDDFVQKQIDAKAVGTTMVNLNTGLLTSLELAVPDWDEQVAIVDRIMSFTAKVRAEESTLSKLQNLKRGLSYDLLTGRKRVVGGDV